MLTSILVAAIIALIAVIITMSAKWSESDYLANQRNIQVWELVYDSLSEKDKYRVMFADSDRKINELRDNVKDTIRILAEQRPIDFEVYKLLVADCKCDYCVELFRDYLDFSEGFAADAAPSLADDVLAFKEEATGRGNTVEMPIPTIIVNPTASQLGIKE